MDGLLASAQVGIVERVEPTPARGDPRKKSPSFSLVLVGRAPGKRRPNCPCRSKAPGMTGPLAFQRGLGLVFPDRTEPTTLQNNKKGV